MWRYSMIIIRQGCGICYFSKSMSSQVTFIYIALYKNTDNNNKQENNSVNVDSEFFVKQVQF